MPEPAPSGPPPLRLTRVTTNPATNITTYSATLNGSVVPYWKSNVFFEYGLTTSYEQSTPFQSEGPGNTSRNVSANIGSLLAEKTYHFRIVASNNGITEDRFGRDKTFETKPIP